MNNKLNAMWDRIGTMYVRIVFVYNRKVINIKNMSMRIARRINNDLFIMLTIPTILIQIILFLLTSLVYRTTSRYKTSTSVKYHRVSRSYWTLRKYYIKNMFYRYSGIYKRVCAIANSISDHIVQICIGS